MIRPAFSSLLLASLLSLPALEAAKLPLVTAHQAQSEIVIAPEASPVERYAAAELQRAIQLATGAELSITQSHTPGKAQIVIGSAGHSEALRALGSKAPTASLEHDQIVIHQSDQTLYLAGSNPRSALYATYRFLEELLGFHWFWPGEGGEYYRKQSDLIPEDLDITESANIQYRYLAINSPHYDEPTLIWMARNRMNLYPTGSWTTQERERAIHEKGFLNRYSGHNLVLPVPLLQEHPEYLAEYGGRRALHHADSSHLCWSNPGVQEALIDAMRGWRAKHPLVDIWSFYPADNTHFCQCAACVAMAPDTSTRFQKLSRIIIETLRKEQPELEFATLAYQNYRDVPTEAAPYELVQYATYNVSFRHFLSSDHPANQTAVQEIRQWRKLGVPLGIRAYDMIPFNTALFVPNISYMIDQIGFMKREGLNSFSTEVTPFGHPKKNPVPPHQENWVTNRMNLYAVAQAMWSADTQTAPLVERWTQNLYGPRAAEPMARYYHTMEEAWRTAPGDLSYFLNPPAPLARGYIAEELISRVEKSFQEARELLAEEADPAFRERALEQVALEEAMFVEWKKLYALLQENAERYHAIAAPAPKGDADLMNPADPAWEDAPRMPHFVAVGEKKVDPTDISMLWKDGTLYLRAICHESDPEKRVLRFHQHDQDIWGEDSLELFVNPQNSTGYYHLAVNSAGTRYDARSLGGMNLDLSANPDWRVRTTADAKGWAAVIALPLAEFGTPGTAGSEVHLSIKRNRPGRTGSGWPDASYHSPSSHGTILLSETGQRSVLLYRADRPKITAVESFFRKKGWRVDYLESDEDFDPQRYQVVYLRYGVGTGFAISADYIRERLLPWVEAGGLLIISASQPVPFVHWLGRDDLTVQWSGWQISPARRSTAVEEGPWVHQPNALGKVLSRLVTPSSGFIPVTDQWETLATLPMKDGREVAYLLRTQVEQGQIVLTSSNMGYGGGHEMFGNQNPENVALLIENLHHALQTP